jgi:RNA polymerase sigma-70 factor, ECF subfamily
MGTISYTFDETRRHPQVYGGQTEASIIHRILGGQRDLFYDLIEPHMGILRHVVRKKMGNDADADDVIQEALVKSFANLKQFRFEASFRTWLVRIAHNEAGQNWRRKLSIHRVAQGQSDFTEVTEATDPHDSPFSAYVRRQTTRSIQLALSSLP